VNARKISRGKALDDTLAAFPKIYNENYEIDPADDDTFISIMELCVLPWLHDHLPGMLGDAIVINHSQGPNLDERLLYISTPEDVDPKIQEELLRDLSRLLPKSNPEVLIYFRKGDIERCGGAKNGKYWPIPTMGDSIGVKGGLSVGTLGPCMKFGDQFR